MKYMYFDFLMYKMYVLFKCFFIIKYSLYFIIGKYLNNVYILYIKKLKYMYFIFRLFFCKCFLFGDGGGGEWWGLIFYIIDLNVFKEFWV